MSDPYIITSPMDIFVGHCSTCGETGDCVDMEHQECLSMRKDKERNDR